MSDQDYEERHARPRPDPGNSPPEAWTEPLSDEDYALILERQKGEPAEKMSEVDETEEV